MDKFNSLKVWQKVILVILAIGLLIVISPVVAIAALVGVVWFGYFRPDNLKRNISIGVLAVSLVGSFLLWQSRTTQDELDSKQAELNSSTTELREEYESESKSLKDEEEQSKKESASSEAEQSAKDESFEAEIESEYSSMVEENSKNPELEAELNEHINGMISEAQGYFNPDDPNTYQFASSMYINEVQFDTSSNDIYVSVNNDFLSLSDSDKTDVMNSAQNLTIGALLEKEYDLTTSEKQGMFTTVLNGQNTVGSSKVLDVREYTWY